MNIICFPHAWHPYQVLFSQALAKFQIHLRPGSEFSNQYLLRSVDSIAGINFHWIENLWNATSIQQRIRAVIGLRNFCHLARRLGKLIVWTVHNHGRHEGKRLGDAWGYRTIANAADLIIVHSDWSEACIRDSFSPRAKVIVMPHGNFEGLYTPQKPPVEIRRAYELDPDTPVCGLIGGIRAYRGHEISIDALRRMEGEVQLLIAGSAIDSTYLNKIRALIADCRHIALCDRRLTDTEYAEMVQACDVILLPYHNITGSGALLAAWTLGRPVVMSDLPFFREYQPNHRAAGVIMRSLTSECLTECIRELLASPEETRILAARHEAGQYSWDNVVQPVVAELLTWSKRGASGQHKETIPVG